jgi:serine/threonine protein kinase
MSPTEDYDNNPEKNKKSIVGINDQLIKIIEIIGKQDKKDSSFIKESSTLNYFQNVQDITKIKGLEDRLPNIDTDIISLIY